MAKNENPLSKLVEAAKANEHAQADRAPATHKGDPAPTPAKEGAHPASGASLVHSPAQLAGAHLPSQPLAHLQPPPATAAKAEPAAGHPAAEARLPAHQVNTHLTTELHGRTGGEQGTTGHKDEPATPAPRHDGPERHGPAATLQGSLDAAQSAVNHARGGLLDRIGAGLTASDPRGEPHSPASLADRLHQNSGLPDPRHPNASSDPDDHGKGGEAFDAATGNLRDQVAHAHSDPRTNPMTAAMMGLVDEASHSAATSPVNVAIGPDTLVDHDAITLIEDALPEITEIVKRGSGTIVDGAAAGGGAAGGAGTAGAVTAEVVADAVIGAAVTGAAVVTAAAAGIAIGLAINEHNKETFAGIQQAAADAWSPTDSKAETERKAEQGRQAGAARKAEHGSKPGVGLTDPNSDSNPPTPAEIAFSLALQQQLHAGPLFHNPGNVDPGPNGDQNATGPADPAVIAAHTGIRGEETRVGNPGSLDSGPSASGHLTSGGPGHPTGDLDPSAPQGDFNTGPGNAQHKDDGPGAHPLGPSSPAAGIPPSHSNSSTSTGSDDSSNAANPLLAHVHDFALPVDPVPHHITLPDDD